jgi:hypothetical protein
MSKPKLSEEANKVMDEAAKSPPGYKLWDCEVEGCDGAVVGGWEGLCTKCGLHYFGDPGEPSRFAGLRFLEDADLAALEGALQAGGGERCRMIYTTQ